MIAGNAGARGAPSGGARTGGGYTRRMGVRGRSTVGQRAVSVVLVALVAVLVIWPTAGVIRSGLGIGGADLPGDAARLDGRVLLRSVGAAALIGVLATLAGWPGGVLIAARSRLAPLVLVPLLMPSYLAYAGWGMIRAPGTWLGDLIATAGAEGHRWVPLFVGQGLAVLGLALWASPIASVVRGLDDRQDRSVAELIRMERGSPLARAWLAVAVARRWLGLSVLIVSLVMLGSAIPFHLAQLDTWAIVIWRRLDLTPPDQWGHVWLAAWPMVVSAIGAGWWLGARAVRASARVAPTGGARDERREAGRSARVLAVLVLALAVVAPMALFAMHLRSLESLRQFWRLGGVAFFNSLTWAVLAGLASSLIALCVASGLGSASAGARVVASAAVRALVIVGLMPGILVGLAFVASGQAAWWNGGVAPVLAWSARFGFVGALIGCWLAASEPAERRALRALDGADSLSGWVSGSLAWQWPGVAAAGLASAALSLHEIEASVLVQPPGRAALAQQVLSSLHFARDEQLSAAGLVLLGSGSVLAVGAGVMLAIAGRLKRARQPHGAGSGIR